MERHDHVRLGFTLATGIIFSLYYHMSAFTTLESSYIVFT